MYLRAICVLTVSIGAAGFSPAWREQAPPPPPQQPQQPAAPAPAQPRNEVKVPEGEPIPEALAKRCEAYWTAREEKNLEAMYAFYTPAYRKETSSEQFVKENEKLNAIDVVSFECRNVLFEDAGENQALVRVLYVTEPRIFTGQFKALKEDRWEKIDGEWYVVHQEQRLPFTKQPPR